MLSYVKPNRIQELKAISENHQEYYTLSDDETFEEKMENNIGNDWRSEYYTESDLAYYKAIFEEETAKFLRENSEINYIIIERIRELELMEPDKPKLIFAGNRRKTYRKRNRKNKKSRRKTYRRRQ